MEHETLVSDASVHAKVIDARDRFKRSTILATCRALEKDIPNLEAELASLDATIQQAENEFIEALGPTLETRADVAVTLSRARVAVHYIQDPLGFNGSGELPADLALTEYHEVLKALRAAQRKLDSLMEPTFSRAEALADVDRWRELRTFEEARDRVDALLSAEMRARAKATAAGHIVPLLEKEFAFNGDPFAVPTFHGAAAEMRVN